MKDYFIKLFEYNHWANQLVLNVLKDNQVQDEYCLKMFSHVINAQFIWHRRIVEVSNEYKIWDIWSFEEMHNSLQNNYELWMQYLSQLTDNELNRTFAYTNSAGDSFENIVEDALAHLVNHATYHRAQVAKRLRDLDIKPAHTDYISYRRAKKN
jgi:uncharacterized damage-inducible protein DinB